MLCGHGLLSFWSKLEGEFGKGGFSKNSGWQIRLSDMKTDGALGFNYKILETPHGLIRLIAAPLLTKHAGGIYNNTGIIIEKENLFRVTYEAPVYRQNIVQENAPQYQKDEYFSYEGFGANLIESHKLIELV